MTKNVLWCENPKGWRILWCEHGARAYCPLRCRCCDGCGNWRRGRVYARALNGVERHNFRVGEGGAIGAFVTLTSVSGTKTWPEIMRAFQHLIQFLRQRAPLGVLEYMAVKEEGRGTGMRHLHVLMLGYPWEVVSWNRLSVAWKERIGAWNVWLRPVADKQQAAHYVSKYIAKGPPLRSRKAATYSKHFPKLPVLPKPETVTVSSAVVSNDEVERIRPLAVLVRPGGLVVERWGKAGPCDCWGAWSDEGLVATEGGEHVQNNAT